MDWKRAYAYVRPAKILISLRIRAVWSESSLDPFWKANDSKFLLAPNGHSDQTARMRRLIWVSSVEHVRSMFSHMVANKK